jgi:glucose/arabinose dehydrogenase
MLKQVFVLCVLLLASTATTAWAQEKLPTEEDYYPITPLDPPPGVVLESGAIEILPEGKIAVSTRRGEVYIVSGVYEKEYPEPKFQRFASGLHEVLGLAYRDGWLYVTQRCEVTRLKDLDGDGRADRFETVSDFWGISGDYHEYAFGSTFDREGNIWVALCLTGSFTADSPYRGFCFRVTPDGKTIPTCSGIRSPGGVGMNDVGDMFYTDNQGPWNGTCGLKFLKPGGFMGHPVSYKFYELSDALGPKPEEPKSGSRIHIERQRIPQLVPTAVMFPYKKMGQSASGIATDMSQGKFGPFAGQMFVGDQTFSTVMRVYLERVNGVYQGVCFPFRAGIGSGSLGMRFALSGELFVGGTNRGWGSRGGKQYSLDRIHWSGKVPFEIHQMRALPDGFELRFTVPVDRETAGKVDSYALQTYTYIYQSSYGSPEVDQTQPKIESATVSEDGLRVKLKIDGLQLGHVHELHASGVRSQAGLPLLHDAAYYTLNEIPR